MRVPTELELREEYAEMVALLARPDGGRDLEARILAKGRTEMHHLLAYLFVRCLELELANAAARTT